MNPQRYDLIRQSFETLTPRMDRVTDVFFENILTRDPSLQQVFDQGNPEVLKTVVYSGLSAIVANLDRPVILESILYEMGRRHRDLGMQPMQLPIALDSLLFAMREVSESWDNDLEAAWIRVASMVMEHMQRGLTADSSRKAAN